MEILQCTEVSEGSETECAENVLPTSPPHPIARPGLLPGFLPALPSWETRAFVNLLDNRMDKLKITLC